MSSGAIDPIAQTKRVFWRPETATTVLKVGQPVCYNSDAVADHKERTSDPTHLGLTEDAYAYGAQDFTGRLFCVEEPLTANLHAFAGICKALGPKAGADGDMIEIFIPTPGAVVPVWTDQYCTFDRTVMGIRNGEADVSYPGTAIGVAKETIDRGTGADDGLCWMEFNRGHFLPPSDDSGLMIDDECGADVNLNYIYASTIQTAGQLHALKVRGDIAATCLAGCAYGLVMLETHLYATALGQDIATLGVTVQMETGVVASTAKNIYAAILGVEDWNSVAKANMKIAPLKLETYLSGGTAPALHAMIMLNTTGTGHVPDYFIYAQNKQSIAFTESTATVGTKTGAIKICIAGAVTQPCYIRTYTSAV